MSERKGSKEVLIKLKGFLLSFFIFCVGVNLFISHWSVLSVQWKTANNNQRLQTKLMSQRARERVKGFVVQANLWTAFPLSLGYLLLNTLNSHSNSYLNKNYVYARWQAEINFTSSRNCFVDIFVMVLKEKSKNIFQVTAPLQLSISQFFIPDFDRVLNSTKQFL